MTDPVARQHPTGDGSERSGEPRDSASPVAPRRQALRDILDLRLVPAAAAAWVMTIAAFGGTARQSIGMGMACLAALPAVLLVSRRRRYAVAAVMGCAALAALGTGVRMLARDASPLVDLAGRRQSATVHLVVREDPRPVVARGPSGPRVLFPATVTSVRTLGGRGESGGGRVQVLAPAEGWATLVPSQRVVATGLLAPAGPGDLTSAVLLARGPPDAVGPPSFVQRVAARLRAGLRDSSEVLPREAGGLLPGLVLGDVSTMDPVLADDFREAGMSHLLAVSGANCAIVSGAVLLLLRRFSLGPCWTATIAGLVLVGFVILVRPSPSVLRAAVMGGVALLALATGRPRSALPSLAVAVLGLVLVSPELARSVGFTLSVLATAGLLLLAPPWVRTLRDRGLPRGIAEAVAVPVAAYAATAPVIVALTGKVSLTTVPANLLAAPAVVPVTVLGVVATVLTPLWSVLGSATAWLAGAPLAWIITVARTTSASSAAIPWPSGRLGGWFLVAVVLVSAAAVRMFRALPVAPAVMRSARLWCAVAACALVAIWLVPVVRPGWPPTGWMFVACDVGQGDALAVRASRDSALVIDTGPDPSTVDRCLRRLGVTRIPLLVLTHLHADHIGGLAGALHNRSVGAIQVGPLDEPPAAWGRVRRDASAHRIGLLRAGVGETREVAGVRVEVLGPTTAFRATRSDPNNSSIVLRITSRGHTMLFTGDVELEAQQALLRRPADLSAELVKVPHHGSSFSDPRFLAATHARIAVVSVGADNDYGHPAPSLLAMLANLGARTYRTDTSGDVAVCDVKGKLVVVTRGKPP